MVMRGLKDTLIIESHPVDARHAVLKLGPKASSAVAAEASEVLPAVVGFYFESSRFTLSELDRILRDDIGGVKRGAAHFLTIGAVA